MQNRKINKKDNKFNKTYLAIIVATIFVFFLIAIQIRIVDANKEIGWGPKENELADRYLSLKKDNQKLHTDIEKKEKELNMLRDDASKNNEKAEEIKNKIQKYNHILGYNEIKSDGIEIMLDDGKRLENTNASTNIVHDTDLIEIVNILKNAGAEAISINDQRIIYTSPITCIGTVIKVNNQKIAPPFKILASGDPTTLHKAVTMNGGIEEVLSRLGLDMKVSKTKVNISKYR